jgi:hypothetical protein
VAHVVLAEERVEHGERERVRDHAGVVERGLERQVHLVAVRAAVRIGALDVGLEYLEKPAPQFRDEIPGQHALEDDEAVHPDGLDGGVERFRRQRLRFELGGRYVHNFPFVF